MAIADEIKNQWRFGGATKRLVFINIGVFLLVHLIGFIGWMADAGDLEGHVLDQLMATNEWPLLAKRPWTVLTYMFTHFDPFHLLWNMVMFWFSGQLFQGLLGERRMVGNYILGGLSGFAFYALASFMPAHLGLGGNSVILGASAAVMAVFIGIATYQPEVEVGMMFIGSVRLKYVAIVVLALDMISIRAGSNTGGHMAHLGGALYGFMAATFLKRGQADWSMAFVNGLVRIGDFLRGKKRSRLRVAKKPTRRGVMVDVEFNSAKK
ncbi:MAG TPA: rhomboid family intramembrane serine protease, partial [Flavobacteriales bacterium]|nr:rhomboid family intramembrane serine protease [Flavobacteriales bacterium]